MTTPRVALILGLVMAVVTAFNIDIKTPYVVIGSPEESFGYSVALHQTDTEKVLLVGAPEAQTTQPGVVRGGAVYRCRVPDTLDVPKIPVGCSTQVEAFDRTGNKFLSIDDFGNADRNSDGSLRYNYNGNGYLQENKTGQWLGVAVQSTGDNVIACAHRYIRVAHNYRKGTYDTQPIGKCSMVDGSLGIQRTEYTPCWGDTTGYDQTSCLVGSSVDLTGSEVVFGGPGANQGEGKAYMSKDFDTSNTFRTGNQAEGGTAGQWYTGYSTVLCDVNGDGNDDVIASAPRAEGYRGKLLIFNRNSNILNKQMVIDGFQIGEYFGYVMDCADVNGDGNGDVIVGAPYYSLDTSGQARLQATGRVYVFMGSREKYLIKEPVIIDPEISEGSMFGHAVKSAGDLNSDGYDDVLVSAPYNANGVLYVYLGSREGLEKDHCQRITPEDLGVSTATEAFGWSLDAGKDLDNNNYPDVAVGSLSGHVTYLRSLPIIDLDAEVQITPATPVDTESEVLQQLVPDDPPYKAVAVDIKVCFTYVKGIAATEGNQDIQVNYKLTSDYKNPKGFRMYFKPQRESPKSQVFSGTSQVSTSKTKACSNQFQAYFNAEIYDFRHVYFKLEADVEETQFFSRRVVLNQKLIDAAETRVVMQSGCTKPSGVCQADLELAPITYTILPKGWDDIAIGRTDYILFAVNVTNKGEDDAFLSELSVILPRNIIFNRRQAVEGQSEEDISHIKCITKQQEDFTNKVICSLSSELKVGTSEIFGLSVITTNIETISPKQLKFDFFAYVQEPSEELNTLLDDNKATVTINVGYPSGIEIRGRPLRERQPFSNDKTYTDTDDTKSIGPDVRHELEVSIGESSDWDRFDNVELTVKWPMYMVNSTDYLLYLVKVSIEDERADNSRCLAKGQVNPENIKDNTPIKKRAAEIEFEDGPPQNCESDENNCVQFTCQIDVLERGDVVKFSLRARLWESTLHNVGNINVTSYVAVTSVKQTNMMFGPGAKSAIKSQFYPSSATKRNYLWIIIGSIIAGILLLILLIIILWKCGFFKRKAPPTIMAEAHEDAGEG